VPHCRNLWLARLGIVAGVAAALMLSACGRKGPLDPPPLAAAPAATPAQPGQPEAEAGGEVSYGPNGQPIAPRGPRKRIILDTLLD
jgi:predicted small lipoprotein YifL